MARHLRVVLRDALLLWAVLCTCVLSLGVHGRSTSISQHSQTIIAPNGPGFVEVESESRLTTTTYESDAPEDAAAAAIAGDSGNPVTQNPNTDQDKSPDVVKTKGATTIGTNEFGIQTIVSTSTNTFHQSEPTWKREDWRQKLFDENQKRMKGITQKKVDAVTEMRNKEAELKSDKQRSAVTRQAALVQESKQKIMKEEQAKMDSLMSIRARALESQREEARLKKTAAAELKQLPVQLAKEVQQIKVAEKAAQAVEAKKQAIVQNEERRENSVVLLKGWQPYMQQYEVPHVFRWENICVVHGSVFHPNASTTGLIAELDPRCRPAGGKLMFNVIKGNSTARVDVLPDGRVYLVTATSTMTHLSLDGIAFAVNVTDAVGLAGKWGNYGGDFRFASRFKQNAVCVISGLVKSGDWNNIGSVSDDCRPSDGTVTFNGGNHEFINRLDVAQSGALSSPAGGHMHGWVSLDGMFLTQDGGQDLKLASAWKPATGSLRTPKFIREGPVCVVTGSVQTTSWAHLVGNLPEKCRPRSRLMFAVNANDTVARVDVYPNGNVEYVSGGKPKSGIISLSGIKFIAYQ